MMTYDDSLILNSKTVILYFYYVKLQILCEIMRLEEDQTKRSWRRRDCTSFWPDDNRTPGDDARRILSSYIDRLIYIFNI